MKPPTLTPGEWYKPEQSKQEQRLLIAQNGGRIIARFDEGYCTAKGANTEEERKANQNAFLYVRECMQALHDLLHAKEPEALYQARADAREILAMMGWKEE